MAGNNSRTIKLYCPSLSKIVQVVAWEEQRLDLGSIARSFGLEPSTLKLNGHFISRGVDLIASSVTWKSLLSFFSSKGLPTGKDNDKALVVDGKLSKVGTKRAHNPQDDIGCVNQHEEVATSSRGPAMVGNNLLKHKRMREGFISSGENLNFFVDDIPGRVSEPKKSTSGTQLRCSYSGDMKRMREDEAIIAAPSKRIR
ncbi:hypothetical protein FEM48_Zijuj09G0078500 [Ziziphus jujuba var. spinosa]|uniref:Uncharacterized protein n=1 Tax=Ziziphus jujuba var. spinosa TaxID=714518 RepID=A0A978URR6_ZIZJJ|nr:hypothetical protein FEM48_Zijuj09G0078500 [Ziziphus jujuba var. spinosa]